MVTVTIRKRDGEMEIYAEGHANYAKDGGDDIVCASLSTIMQLAELGLKALASTYPEHIKVEVVEK